MVVYLFAVASLQCFGSGEFPTTKTALIGFLEGKWRHHIGLYSNIAGVVHRQQMGSLLTKDEKGGVTREYRYRVAALNDFGKFERTKLEKGKPFGQRDVYANGPKGAFHLALNDGRLPYLHRAESPSDPEKNIKNEVYNYTGEFRGLGMQIAWPTKSLPEYLAMEGFEIEPKSLDERELRYSFKADGKSFHFISGQFALDQRHSCLIKHFTAVDPEGIKVIWDLEFGAVSGTDLEVPRKLVAKWISPSGEKMDKDVLVWEEISFGTTRAEEFSLENYGLKSMSDSASKSWISNPTFFWGLAGVVLAAFGYWLLGVRSDCSCIKLIVSFRGQ